MHEITHICQGWEVGSSFDALIREERLASAQRLKDCLEMFPGGANCALSKNMFETGAYDFDSRWTKAHRDEVNAGKFDFMMPINLMRGLFPNMKNIYR